MAVDEQELRSHVSEVVRQSVEETLNGMLDAEADALCQARRYERNPQNHSAVIRELKRMQDEPGYVSVWEPKTALDVEPAAPITTIRMC